MCIIKRNVQLDLAFNNVSPKTVFYPWLGLIQDRIRMNNERKKGRLPMVPDLHHDFWSWDTSLTTYGNCLISCWMLNDKLLLATPCPWSLNDKLLLEHVGLPYVLDLAVHLVPGQFQDFSVSPSPLDWGFGTRGLGLRLDNWDHCNWSA